MFIGSDIAMTAVAVGLAVHFVRSGRRAYRGVLARQRTAAGVPLPRGCDDDTRLAACNAYPQALHGDSGHAPERLPAGAPQVAQEARHARPGGVGLALTSHPEFEAAPIAWCADGRADAQSSKPYDAGSSSWT